MINAYDNSIVYTDHVLAQGIRWLQTQSPKFSSALLYMSDHGESLGENNLYLNALPYAFAPHQQKQVPMVMWLSDAQQASLRPGCMASQLDAPISHDHLSHTVLGLLQGQTRVYRAERDVTPHVDRGFDRRLRNNAMDARTRCADPQTIIHSAGNAPT